MRFHLFSQAQCLHSYKQSIHLKVLISSTCVPRESNEMQRNGSVTSDTSLWHPFPTSPHQCCLLSDLPQLCHQDLVCGYTSPHFFPTESHLACSFNQLCHCPAFISSPPWPCRLLTPQLSKFLTTGIKFSCLVVSALSLHASRFALLLRFASFHWLLHFYPCFPSCFFSHFYSFSPPQLPSLKFPFLKYAVSLKAFIINLSRNYLRASSAVLWFIRCAVFLASISQELSWSSFYLHS